MWKFIVITIIEDYMLDFFMEAVDFLLSTHILLIIIFYFPDSYVFSSLQSIHLLEVFTQTKKPT